jgi:hypothetical protein
LGILARKEEAKTEFEKTVKILITECEDQGPQYIERRKYSKRIRMRRCIAIKSTEEEKMVLKTMIILIGSTQ